MAKKFAKDSEYLNWLASHPGGYVLNAHKLPKPSYMVLHRATCLSINDKRKGYRQGAFTERTFTKVAAEEEQELRDWLRINFDWFSDFSSVCSQCFKVH